MRYRCCNLINNMLTGVPPDIEPPDPPEPLPFILTFDDPASFPVDPTDVTAWNNLLFVSGTLFTSVVNVGNVINLYGANNTHIDGSQYPNWPGLVSIEDQSLQVTSLAPLSFFAASNLGSVIMNGLLTVPDRGFSQITSFFTASFTAATLIDTLAFESSTLMAVISAPLVQEIRDTAFNNCTSLSIADFPSCTDLVGGGTFAGCSVLETANFPVLINAGNGDFQGCDVLTTVNMPLLEVASGNMFFQCSSLVTLSLPSLLQAAVGATRFCSDCTALEIFSAPLCTAIGSQAANGFFQNCNALTLINLPLCTDFGGTVGNDDIFIDTITGTITVTCTLNVPAILETCNGGNPDGDLADLVAANPGTITINYV